MSDRAGGGSIFRLVFADPHRWEYGAVAKTRYGYGLWIEVTNVKCTNCRARLLVEPQRPE